MYSRRLSIEERRNKRKAFLYIILTIVAAVAILFFGIPNVAKFATFLSEFKNTGTVPEADDTTPPPPPRFDALPEATKESSVEVNGNSEPGSKVVISLNNKNQEVLVNNEGRFNLIIELKKGENTLQGYSEDAAGNKSTETNNFMINYDTEPPNLELLKPQDNATFYGTKQRQMVLEGKTEEGVQVQVNDRIVVVFSDGTFSFAITLNEGENLFNIKATDKAGNISEKSLKVNFIP